MKISSPIFAFVLASTGLHAGLVMTSYNQTTITLPGSSGSVMTVKLKAPPQGESLTKPEKTEPRNISKTAKQVLAKKSLKKAVTHAERKQVHSSTSQKKNSVSKAQVVSLIYKELSNHFTYPRLAQKRNWQGQVLLAFRLNNDGTIEDIKINHSSGYNVLDQAAIISLKKIGQLPQVSSWLFDGMEIQLPVIYQLTQG